MPKVVPKGGHLIFFWKAFNPPECIIIVIPPNVSAKRSKDSKEVVSDVNAISLYFYGILTFIYFIVFNFCPIVISNITVLHLKRFLISTLFVVRIVSFGL